ncbi:hypothetical protein NL676_011313 [Syzygium grande]|nr:hypothetical protein NL676_011313 [Syzygium grande]
MQSTSVALTRKTYQKRGAVGESWSADTGVVGGRGAKDARVVANGGADPIDNEVVGVGDDGLLQSLEGDIGVAKAEFLEGNGWVDGDALVAVAKLVEVVEEVVVLGVVGGGSKGRGRDDGEGGDEDVKST